MSLKAHWENIHSPAGDRVTPMREPWHRADVGHELRLAWSEDVDGEGILGLPPDWAAVPCLGLFTHLPLSAISEQLKD